ncbi:MAG: hypothetical protein GF341_10490 [candidate division Zixibacteria bacterium]|nr:hypothetical protein [candidate division Zixibacteria bacterium]
MSEITRLIRLCHHRWTIPILAELQRSNGSRFAAMANRLGLSRDTLTKTLADMMTHRWVRRNPGYGHPLRPEYILTAAGQRLGPICIDLMNTLERSETGEIILNKWSLPVLHAIDHGHDRFASLKEALPGITPRALTLTLKELQEIKAIERTVVDEFPPSTRYALSNRGRHLAQYAETLI